MQTRACDFCGTDIEPGTGTMFVFVSGRVDHYCSSKCEKNVDLGRVPREVEWTDESRRLRQRRQRTVGSQEDVETVAADAPEEAGGPAEDVDTVPEESEAQAVAAATSDRGADEETAAGTTDDRVDAAAESDAEARTAGGAQTEELDEVAGRRAGGDDPDIEEDVQHEDSSVERRDPDPDDAAASAEDTTRETDADSDTEFDAEDVERTGEETVSQEEADEVITEEETDEDVKNDDSEDEQ
ncbi:50S ribosomal protein L24 [Halobacteriales archaeon QS_3_64_16]|nr:MAG: 50S ribosomal protein L24 [Halobacteriales archaeon QS_3_64_16]